MRSVIVVIVDICGCVINLSYLQKNLTRAEMKISNLLHYLYQPDPEIVLYGAQLDIHKSLPELAKVLSQ